MGDFIASKLPAGMSDPGVAIDWAQENQMLIMLVGGGFLFVYISLMLMLRRYLTRRQKEKEFGRSTWTTSKDLRDSGHSRREI